MMSVTSYIIQTTFTKMQLQSSSKFIAFTAVRAVRMIQGIFSCLLVNPSLIMRSGELSGQYLILNNEVTPARYSLRTHMSA